MEIASNFGNNFRGGRMVVNVLYMSILLRFSSLLRLV